MRIVTWNINSIRLRIDLLARLISEVNPDVIALQETKCPDDKFPLQEIKQMGFSHCAFSGQKSYNGVATLSKLPLNNIHTLAFYNEDKRHIAVSIGDIEFHNFYVPAGGDEPNIETNPKFKHKLAFLELMRRHFIASPNENRIIMGDFNIAPYEHDVWSSKQLRNVVSHTDIERETLLKLAKDGKFLDSAREFVPMSDKCYSWWSYRNKDWEKTNRGRRLDHIWSSIELKSRLKKIDIFSDARNWPSPSDHVPYILDIV